MCNADSKIKSAQAYDYSIGDEALEIPLADLWDFRTSCCALTPKSPQITSDLEPLSPGLIEISEEF